MASVHATRSSDATQWPISSCESGAEDIPLLCPSEVSTLRRSCAKPATPFLLDSYVKPAIYRFGQGDPVRRFLNPCEAPFETCRAADILQDPFCSVEIARMMARRFDPSPNPRRLRRLLGTPIRPRVRIRWTLGKRQTRALCRPERGFRANKTFDEDWRNSSRERRYNPPCCRARHSCKKRNAQCNQHNLVQDTFGQPMT